MRLYAKDNHSTFSKVDKLISFLRDDLKLEVSFYHDRIFVKDMEMSDKDWEIVDLSGNFINQLPADRYRLARDMEYDASPRQGKSILGMTTKDMQYEPTR